MRGETIAIELGKRRGGAGGLAEAADVRRRQKQPRVPRLSELVHLDEPCFELGTRGDVLGLQGREPCGDAGELALESRPPAHRAGAAPPA